jgi:type IV pilus assembly protein PilC
MAQFAYRAMDAKGRIARGHLDAVNSMDLEMRLRRMNLDLIRFSAAGPKARLLKGGIGRRELINFCFHLEQLFRSGVPIIEALTDLRDSVNHPQFREVLANVIESIEGGKRLSEALAEHPKVFDNVFVALVDAGERSGKLDEVLRNLTENLKWQDEIASQTLTIMLYPVVTAVVTLAAVIVLLTLVVPKLAAIVQIMQPQLDTSTKILIAVSAFASKYWPVIVLAPVALGFLGFYLIKTNSRLRYDFDGWKLRLPIFGTVYQKIILARFATFFALMYSTGIGVLDCLRVTEKIAGNKVIEDGLQRVGEAIAEGHGVTDGFQRVGLFPPLVLRMIRVGETTGALDTALGNVGYFYNREVKEAIARAQQLIQPTMLLILLAIFVFVLVPVFSPIYDAITKVKF